MAMFNSHVANYQKVNLHFPMGVPMIFPFSYGFSYGFPMVVITISGPVFKASSRPRTVRKMEGSSKSPPARYVRDSNGTAEVETSHNDRKTRWENGKIIGQPIGKWRFTQPGVIKHG